MTAARNQLRAEAEFLVSIQAEDGSFPEGYDLSGGSPQGEPHLLLAQGFGVRGLLRAYEVLKEDRYLEAARAAIGYMNTHLWDDEVGIYRSSEGAAVTVYTPMNLGAALGALREWILVARDASQVHRYKRLHVQGLDRSGILLAEETETGEVDTTDPDGNSDGDSIKWFGVAGKGHRPVAAVHASCVEIETPLGTRLPELVGQSSTGIGAVGESGP
ncbi:MAG: hypothetical protein ACE5HU_09675 [Acidobacteriota bacterium]